MKARNIAIIPLFLLPPLLSAQISEEGGSSSPKLTYISLGLSMANGSFNSYKVGNANEFYQFLLQDNSLELDDGALGFKQIGFGGLNVKSKSVLGYELNFQFFHSTHAIAGQDMSLNSGLNASMHFGLKTIDIAFRFGPKLSESGANLSAEIGVLYGFMSGTILQGSDEWKQKGALFSPGMRGGLAVDVPIKKSIIIFARMGYRYLLIEEKHVDHSTGKSVSFYANGSDGDLVKVDWSGAYASVGLGLVLKGKKKKN